MRFPELEPFKQRLPKLTAEISRAEEFVSEVFARPGKADEVVHDIRPVQLANRLSVDEPLALVLLKCFDDAGIVTPRYDVICPNTGLVIESYSSKADLPQAVSCPFEIKTQHTFTEYYVELVFQFTSTFVKKHRLPV